MTPRTPDAGTPDAGMPDGGTPSVGPRARPLLIVHTGDGKGKTTAAFGLALRGWAQGWSVGIYQFVKSARWPAGERTALETLGRLGHREGTGGPVTVEVLGSGCSWLRSAGPLEDQASLARAGWDHVRAGLAARAHTMWILDELTHPLRHGWLDIDDVVETLTGRPGFQHVVVTGRGCPDPLRNAADLVTEMTKVRHPFDAGVRGQPGIEW